MKNYHKYFLLIALIVLFEYDIIPFKTFGFKCKDPLLSHKYRGDTIPFLYLLITTLVCPLAAMLLVEFLALKSTPAYLGQTTIGRVKTIVFWYGQYLLGFLIVLFLTQFGKSVIGEPRPHFFDTCKPDKGANCTSGFIYEFKCTNKLSNNEMRDSFKSFPSGHSSVALFSAVTLAGYLQARVPNTHLLLVPWLQCLSLSWGLICALSRITDHRHHWWDVLAGSILGVLMAIVTIRYFCDNFRTGKSTDKNFNENGNENGNNA